MASREMRGLPGGGIASEGGWGGGARGRAVGRDAERVQPPFVPSCPVSTHLSRSPDDRAPASGPLRQLSARHVASSHSQARASRTRASRPLAARGCLRSPPSRPRSPSRRPPRALARAPRAPRAPLARGTSSGPTPASSPRRRVAACVARRRRAGKPKRPSARSTPSSRGPRTSPSPSPRCAIPRGTGVPTRASRSITSITIQPPSPSASPTCALSSPRADPPLTLARSSLTPPPPRGHAAHQEPAPKPDPNERKPGEVSEAMKARLRDEYVGLGGTPSKPMPSNLFLNIILGISALAVLCKLGGIL